MIYNGLDIKVHDLRPAIYTTTTTTTTTNPIPDGNSLDKLRHTRSVAYSVELAVNCSKLIQVVSVQFSWATNNPSVTVREFSRKIDLTVLDCRRFDH